MGKGGCTKKHAYAFSHTEYGTYKGRKILKNIV